MKVLLFSNDLMPFGNLPTSGGGLRCWQLRNGLISAGIEVLSSMPGFTYLAEKHYDQIPEEQRELLWRWETQEEILKRTKPDAVIFASNWDHYGLSKKPSVPLIIDLHGSRLIETSMWNQPVDTNRKVQVLSQADCLLTAGLRQRMYFYGWLVQAGRVPVDEHFIRYIPVSMPPEIQQHQFSSEDSGMESSERPFLVSGGGWFPWQNQSKTIFEACRFVEERKKGSIEIFGTPHETQNMSAEERVIRDIYAAVSQLASKSDRIRVNGYVGRNDLLKIYNRSSVALEAMQYNLERELAFTTRTIEYLWCGLPVLYNDFGEISAHIREYDAGWTVNPESREEICAALEEIFSNPQLVRQKSLNASRLVSDRFSWDKTIAPLVDFLNAPVVAPAVVPAIGTVGIRSSFLNPTGIGVNIDLQSGETIRQRFVIPAENVATIELTAAPGEKKPVVGSSAVISLNLKRVRGSTITSKRFALDSIPSNGQLLLNLPLLRRPKGGVECLLEISCLASGENSADKSGVPLRGLLKSSYPFVAMSGVSGRTVLGIELAVEAVAINFIVGTGRVYRIKALAVRAFMMLKQGQWRRLLSAARRRFPLVVQRLKSMSPV